VDGVSILNKVIRLWEIAAVIILILFAIGMISEAWDEWDNAHQSNPTEPANYNCQPDPMYGGC
jgi:hypothetical protein